MLRVAEPLDHELSREYFLTILARDHGSPPLSNTAIVSINITDVNDNPPRFSQDAYSATVNELAPEGTEVFKVLCHLLFLHDSFYLALALFSTLELTHCTLVICNSE